MDSKKKGGKVMVKVRASSIGELFDCPARWEAKHIRDLRLPTSGAARLGTAIHAGAATFDLARMEHKPENIEEAESILVKKLYNKEDEDVDWGESNPSEAEKIALPLLHLYCENIAPLMTYVGVEVQCEDLTISDLGLTLTGTCDRVTVDADGCIGIADIKTGKTIVSADGTVNAGAHALQLGAYELLVEASLEKKIEAPASVIGLQVAKTQKGQRVAVGQVQGAKDALLGSEHCMGLLEYAAKMIKSGLFHGNPKSSTCHPRFCPIYGTCSFHK